MIRRFIIAAVAAAALGLPAFGQNTVSVTLTGVSEAGGVVRVGLCDGSKGHFPMNCNVHEGVAEARAGDTTVEITGVKPGTYAVWMFHDANRNNVLNFPVEGYAYGNDASYPPSFAGAAIKVDGPTSTRAQMTYANDPSVVTTIAGTVRMGSTGAPAPIGVTKIDVRENGLYAELYAPTGMTGLPTLILLGGSEGGLLYASRMAQSFTRQGYTVLALAYFAELGLPRTLESVPLEYFDKAIAWLKRRPEVDAENIGVIGGSRGSEAALLVASRNPEVKAVMVFAPSGLVLKGIDPQNLFRQKSAWSIGGKDIPFVPLDFSKTKDGKVSIDMYLPGLEATPDAEIAVEKINGPILLISGEDDQLWPSTQLAELVEARLRAKKFNHHVEHLRYPGAGHQAFRGDPAGIPAPVPGGPVPATLPGMSLGGSPSADFAAWTDNWPKTLKFFDNALRQH